MNRKMFGAVALIFGLFPASLFAGTVPIWGTGFETGLGGEWSSSSSNFSVVNSSLAFEGTHYLNVIGPSGTGGDTLSLPTPSVGYDTLSFEGQRRIYAGLESTDRLSIQWKVDGLDWQTPVIFSGLPVGDWSPFLFNLPAEASDNPTLTFRWLAEFDGANDRALLDNLSLSGQPVPEPATLGLLVLGALTGARRYHRG